MTKHRLHRSLRHNALGLLRRGGGAPAFVGAYDAIPDIVAAYGMRRLLSSYTGPILRLRRDSDQTEQDFGYTDNGDLDVAAIAAWLSGANGLITTWYDQSGNANHATQTTAAAQPLYVASGQNGRPVAYGDGSRDLRTLSALPVFSQQAIMVLAKANGILTVLGSESYYKVDNLTTAPRYLTSAGGWGENVARGPNGAPGVWELVCALYDGAQMRVYLNGVGGSPVPATGTIDGSLLALFSNLGSSIFSGQIAEAIIATTAWDTTTRQAAETAANSYWSVY